MQKAEQWAISQGYSELASDTKIDNNRSISMHKHLGVLETERIVCFLKRLKMYNLTMVKDSQRRAAVALMQLGVNGAVAKSASPAHLRWWVLCGTYYA